MREPRYSVELADGEEPISTSTIETYLRCGLRLQFQIESGHRWATVPMAIGTGVAKAAETDNCAKLAEGGMPSFRELVEIGVTAYDSEVESCEVPGSRHEIDQGRDTVAQATLAYARDVSPGISDVLSAEHRLGARIADGLVLVGTPDVVCRGKVRDVKTGQPWTPDRVSRSRQLTAYSLLYRSEYGSMPSRVAIDSVHRERNGDWRGKTLWSYREQADADAFVVLAEGVRDGIKAGVFLPAPEIAWWCSEAHCPFWQGCPAVAGRRGRKS